MTPARGVVAASNCCRFGLGNYVVIGSGTSTYSRGILHNATTRLCHTAKCHRAGRDAHRGIYMQTTALPSETRFTVTARHYAGIYGTVLTSDLIAITLMGLSGAGGDAIEISGKVGFLGYNAFYNNTATNNIASQIYINKTANDVALGASPFTNAAGGDFSVSAALKALGFPISFLGASTNTYIDIGAAQRNEPAAALVTEAGGGTYHEPSVGEVIDTAVFGPASGTAGTFAIPAEVDVKDGVDYGEDGTEFEGTYVGAGGGGVPVIGGNVVRR